MWLMLSLLTCQSDGSSFRPSRVWGSGFKAQGLGFRVQVLDSKATGVRFIGFRVGALSDQTAACKFVVLVLAASRLLLLLAASVRPSFRPALMSGSATLRLKAETCNLLLCIVILAEKLRG